MSAKIGSLAAFWPLLVPVMEALAPRRVCEVGVESGDFTRTLLDWCAPRGCAYVGIDPAPSATLEEVAPNTAADATLVRAPSLDALPRTEPCDAYFLDGDHNYYTVVRELQAIAEIAERTGRGVVVVVHDVGWPWGRRDLYYAPDAVPAEHRHAYSTELGVLRNADELVDGGLRDPGRYAIAFQPGGPGNGVLTAVEDFVASTAADRTPWLAVVVPAAYGLALVVRPDLVPPDCALALGRVADAVATMGGFLGVLESNFLDAYLFGEHVRAQADGLSAQVAGWQEAYGALDCAYADLSAHAASLLERYRELEAAAGLGQPQDS